MKQRFEKYDFEVLLLEGSYVSDPKVRRAVIEDGDDRCSVEEYSSRCFRRLGYSALRVENEPIAALFGVFMSPLIPHGRMFGVGDRFAFDAGTRGKLIWTRLPDDFGKPVYGVRRAAAINDHLRTITGQSHQLQDLRQYLWGHRSEQIQVARQLIDILPSGSILEMLRYLVEDYWARRSGWPDLLIFKENEFFFAEVKSERDKLGKSQQRWLRDNQERLHFPFKLVEVRRIELEAVAGT